MLRSLRTRTRQLPAVVLAVCVALTISSCDDKGGQASTGAKAPTEKKEKTPPPAPKCTEAQVANNKKVAREQLENVNGDWDLDAEMAALDELWGGISGWCHQWYNEPKTLFGLGGLSDKAWGHRQTAGRSESPTLQARISLDYIRDTYGSPQAAWEWWNCTKNCKQKQQTIPEKAKGAKAWY